MMDDATVSRGLLAGPLPNRAPARNADSPCTAFQRLLDQIEGNGDLAPLREALTGSGPAPAFIDAVFSGSPYLASLALRHPEDLQAILTAPPGALFDEAMAAVHDAARTAATIAEAMRSFRRLKDRVALLTAFADLGGAWDIDEATRRLSTAADTFVKAAVTFLLRQAASKGRLNLPNPDDPEAGSGLIVIGMGKCGGRELNYSSDIDLIVFYDRDRAPLAPGVEPGPFFVRLTRDLVQLLQERTAEGYVYRVDLRLRPDPGSTQVAISTSAALHYYETFGQNWERAAFIKARQMAGDTAAGEELLRELGPYVWRKYLDYNAIADIHAMKRQIHAVKGHAKIAVAGHNLKLGRGGIREIEFFVQSQQLIAGGREPQIRSGRTLEALEQLRARDWISAEAAGDMSDAYCFLRRIEHRLQMVADEQTQTLPARQDDLERFARFAGYERPDDFESELRAHLTRVQSHYAALFEHTPELTAQRAPGNLVFTGDTDDPATVETLTQLGFRKPSAAIASVKGWHYGRSRAVRGARARERLTEFTPALLEAFGETADPDLALASFDRFLAELPSGLQLFSLLHANPDLLRMVAKIMGSAPRLARILSRRRHLLDGILDPRFLGEEADAESLRQLLERERAQAISYEDWLDRARIVGQEQAFLIGAQLLSRSITADQAGRAYSLLADAIIQSLQEGVMAAMSEADRHAEVGQVAILGMGKLGGEEMTASSDLDLIVIYDAAGEAGHHVSPFYARFTQRLISALSAPTANGRLYEVDMRLRPSGKAGPVAVSIAGFANYQRNDAWTWEHLALTRARVVSGPPALRDRLQAEISEVLRLQRDRAKIVSNVRDMRALTLQEKDKGDFWDLKNSRGGLLDVEFIAQFLQIAHAADHPQTLSQNTLEALHNLKAAGVLAPGHAETLIQAATLYHSVMQILRLCTEGRFIPGTASAGLKELLANAANAPDFSRLEADIKEAYTQVAALFETLVA